MVNVYLTEFDLQILDPTGKAREKLGSYKKSPCTPTPKMFRDLTSEEYLQEYLELRRAISKRHSVYSEYDAEFDCKYGGQGDVFPLSEMEEKIEQYYAHASCAPTFHPTLIEGRDYFLRLLKQKIEQVGYPQIDFSDRGVDGTLAALPTMYQKGEFLAETVGAKPWRHPWPSLPGQRSQRQKHRIIFMDSVLNVRYLQPILAGCKKWLVKYFPHLFSPWINPREVLRPMVSDALVYPDVYSVETDYDSCDMHFSFGVVSEIVLPIYEVLIPDPMVFSKFASFVEELFWQPLFMGDHLITGLHCLFSGQPITNDFETLYGIVLSLAGAISAKSLHGLKAVLVNGDDISVLLRGEKQARIVHDTMVDISTQAGLVMSLPKCRIGHRNVRFCKMLYYPEGKRENIPGFPRGVLYGAYPGILALLNIIHPEAYSKDEASEWGASLQRADNVVGAPHFAPFVVTLFKHARKRVALDNEIVAQTGWWERLYGLPWTLRDSPSYRTLVQNNLW